MGDNWKLATAAQRIDIENLAKLVRDGSADLLKQNKSLVNLITPKSIPKIQNLNPVERILMEFDLGDGAHMILYGGSAYLTNRVNFSNGQQNNNENGNAFQHAYWNYLMAYSKGYDEAKKWGDAHEYGLAGNVGGIEFEMDMFNNEYGRQLGMLDRGRLANILSDPWAGTPKYDPIGTLLNHIGNGKLLRIDSGSLV